MAKSFEEWRKEAKKALVDLDMTNNEFAEKVGYSREYASSILCGRHYSLQAVQKISQALGIEPPEGSTIIAP
jgi:transcriptional regulator with XRE-family HTH domain